MSSKPQVPLVVSRWSNFNRAIRPYLGDADTKNLYKRAQELWGASSLGEEDAEKLAFTIASIATKQAFKRRRRPTEGPLFDAFLDCAYELVLYDELLHWPILEPTFSMEQGYAVREFLRRKIAFLQDANANTVQMAAVISSLLGVFLDQVPPITEGPFTLSLGEMVSDPARTVDELHSLLFTQNMLNRLTLQLFMSTENISGITETGKMPTPASKMKLPREEVFPSYLTGTPLLSLIDLPLTYGPPFEQRFEGTWVLGGPGSGKTQLIQRLIASDIDKYGIVVIDSQDEMIDKIAHLAILKNKDVVIIDPRDVEHPTSLNLLDLGLDRATSYSEEDRRALENSALDMYSSIFGSLFGAELSSKQSVVFTALAKLLMKQPGANLLTFFDLMYDPETLTQCLVQADTTTRLFFEHEWPRPDYKETKSQILRRLWAIRMNETFCSMFSHKRNKINLFDAMQRGAVVLIKTSQSFLQPDWSAIFGKFFIILLQMAIVERSTIKDHDKRTPCFVYIDECFEYLKGNDRLGYILNQARKYRCGIHLCHQNVEQIPRDILGSFKSSTAIKFASGVSGEDRSTLAREMDIEPDFFRDLKKIDGEHGEWVCWVRGQGAVKVRVPFGVLEQLPRMTNEEYAAMLGLIRHRYGPDRDEPPEIIPDDRVEFLPPDVRPTEQKKLAAKKGVHRWEPPEF